MRITYKKSILEEVNTAIDDARANNKIIDTISLTDQEFTDLANTLRASDFPVVNIRNGVPTVEDPVGQERHFEYRGVLIDNLEG